MKVWVEKLTKEQWKPMSENAHTIVFGTRKPESMDRIDFALIVRNEEGLMGYLTCREHDAETLYWQYGGAFPGTRGSSLTFLGYQQFVVWCKERYKRITTLVENDNIAMLKMAMKVGYRVVGVRTVVSDKTHILLEHVLEF